MVSIDEYLKGILGQILASYKILTELNDEPKDLLIIKKVLSNKLDNKKYQSDHLVSLYKLSTYYTSTYDFTWEIEKLSQIYYNDSNRVKNLRFLIINSLNDKKLMEKLEMILIKL